MTAYSVYWFYAFKYDSFGVGTTPFAPQARYPTLDIPVLIAVVWVQLVLAYGKDIYVGILTSGYIHSVMEDKWVLLVCQCIILEHNQREEFSNSKRFLHGSVNICSSPQKLGWLCSFQYHLLKKAYSLFFLWGSFIFASTCAWTRDISNFISLNKVTINSRI